MICEKFCAIKWFNKIILDFTLDLKKIQDIKLQKIG